MKPALNMTPGQVAYAAYRARRRLLDIATCRTLPAWAELSGEEQDAWEHAGRAIMAATEQAKPVAR